MKRLIAFFVVIILLAIGANSVTYIVYEDEVAVVKQFGKIVKVVVNAGEYEQIKTALDSYDKVDMSEVAVYDQKGLHFKLPFAETVQKFDSKYLTYMSRVETINTKDKRELDIQMYAQFRIINPAVFNTVVGTEKQAYTYLDDRVYPVVIQSANALQFQDFFNQETLDGMIATKQAELNKQLVEEFGIYITDIGINRKTFPSSNIESIENKMAVQIQKDIQTLQSEGDALLTESKAKTDREQKEIVAKATEEAAIIKADADAEAISIYQESLQKNLDFYRFIKTMEIYKDMKDVTIFIDKDNRLFQFINGYQ